MGGCPILAALSTKNPQCEGFKVWGCFARRTNERQTAATQSWEILGGDARVIKEVWQHFVKSMGRDFWGGEEREEQTNNRKDQGQSLH